MPDSTRSPGGLLITCLGLLLGAMTLSACNDSKTAGSSGSPTMIGRADQLESSIGHKVALTGMVYALPDKSVVLNNSVCTVQLPVELASEAGKTISVTGTLRVDRPKVMPPVDLRPLNEPGPVNPPPSQMVHRDPPKYRLEDCEIVAGK